MQTSNCPEINVTEDASKRDPDFRPQPHCPLNSVTESASLKSLKSQGGDLVEGSSKWDYVRVMSERYQNACRKEKRLILDELEKNLKVHRKSAVRALNYIKNKKPKEARGRRRIYNDFVIQHLKKLWLEMGQLCSRRMKKALPRSLRHIKEGFLKPNVYAPKGTTLKLPDNESLCCTPRPDRG